MSKLAMSKVPECCHHNDDGELGLTREQARDVAERYLKDEKVRGLSSFSGVEACPECGLEISCLGEYLTDKIVVLAYKHGTSEIAERHQFTVSGNCAK